MVSSARSSPIVQAHCSTVQNAFTLNFVFGSSRFDNAGTFRKTVNIGTAAISSGVSFNNYGTVEIQAGTLLCNGSFVNNGVVNLSAGTTNRLGAGGSGNGLFIVPPTALVE